MRVSATSVFLAALAASTATAQSVVGSAYGFATGVTGGGSASAVTPTSADELADLLGDDTPRTIVIGQEFDFTGTTATDSGCDRKSCSASNGGQLYLGDLSCGGDDNVAVSSITYDVAGTEPLLVGSNKSILGANGQGVLKGKGLRFKKGASNIIVQGVEITDLNPGIVWGGDAIDFQGSNDGVWVDHCKVSLVGRMFAVSHYDPSRITLSNNEFDGRTTTSASCDDNHYWTMMFYGDGDQVTLDRNYFHHVSGRAPKLGQAGTTGTFQASNNYFADMKGHAFDAADGATAILEGNVFESVKQPMTAAAADVSTIFNVPDAQAAEACAAQIGRACVPNAVDSSSGELPAMSGSGALQTWSSLTEYLVDPVDAADVAGLVSSGAGPANLGSSAAAPAQPAPVEEAQEEEEVEETPAQPQETEEAAPVEEAPVEEAPVEEAPVEEAPVEDDEDEYEYEEDCTPATPEQPGPVEEEDDDEYEYEEDCTPATPEQPEAPSTPAPQPEAPSTPEPEPVTGQEAQPWGQCGGNGWTGATKCAAGTSCVVQNDWYSQCLSSAARRKTRALRHVA